MPARSKQISTTSPKTSEPKLSPDATIIYDSLRTSWTEISSSTGAKKSDIVTDSKGNIYTYYNYNKDSSNVYKLVGGKWNNISQHAFKTNGKLFVDAWDNLFALTANRVYKLNGDRWDSVWKIHIPELSRAWIALDGQLYSKSWLLDSELAKWDGEKWKAICRPYTDVYIDKTGKVYSYSRGDAKTWMEAINEWNGREWVKIGEEKGFSKIWIDKNNNLYVHVKSRLQNNEFNSVLKKWDGITWSNIALPMPGGINEIEIDQFGNIVLDFVENFLNKHFFCPYNGEFKSFDYGSQYGFSYMPIVSNNKVIDLAYGKLWEYSPGWKVTSQVLYPIPVKAGTNPGFELDYDLKNWKIFKGPNGLGVRTLNNRIMIHPDFDTIRLENSPLPSSKNYAFYLRKGNIVIVCSTYISNPDYLDGFFEVDRGDCPACENGQTAPQLIEVEKKGAWVEGYTSTTSTPRSSGGYTIKTITVPGYHKPSTYEKKLSYANVRACPRPNCRKGRIIMKQRWKHYTFYNEYYDK